MDQPSDPRMLLRSQLVSAIGGQRPGGCIFRQRTFRIVAIHGGGAGIDDRYSRLPPDVPGGVEYGDTTGQVDAVDGYPVLVGPLN